MILTRSKEWIAKQLLTIGSSAAGIVAGESPYPDATPAKLYDAMIAAAEDRVIERDINDDMKRGLYTEEMHRWLLEDKIKHIVAEHDQDEFLYNAEYPWAHALPDGWVFENDLRIPVQLKCPRIRSWHEITLKGIHGHWLLGSQHTLAVTGAPYEYFSVLNVETMQLISMPVYRDEKLISQLMAMEKRFFHRFEERDRPADMPEAKIELPDYTGDYITLESVEAADAAETLIASKQLLEDAQELHNSAKQKIESLMGDVRAADLPGLRCYRIRSEGRVSIDADAMKKDGIDPAKYEKRGKPFYQFRSYERN